MECNGDEWNEKRREESSEKNSLVLSSFVRAGISRSPPPLSRPIVPRDARREETQFNVENRRHGWPGTSVVHGRGEAESRV